MFGVEATNVNLEELRFYFDSQEKNVIDQGRFGYKAGVAMSLRHKLMSLAEKDFDSAVSAIDRIITPDYKPNHLQDQRREFDARRNDSQELYAAASVSGSSGDEVSRV